MIVYENFYAFLFIGSNTVGLTGAMRLQHLQSHHPERYNIPTNNSMSIGGNIEMAQNENGGLPPVVRGIPVGIIIIYEKLTNETDVQM